MTKRILRNSVIFTLSITGIVYLYRTWMGRNGPLVRVVVFHDVTDADWFAKMLTILTKRYHVLTPEAFLKKEFNSSKINVLVTFDDGYASWVHVCLPLLKRFNTQALFFVNSGLLDVHEQEDVRAQFVRERLRLKASHATLSWDNAKLLHEAGHTIGGHTKTHLRLSELEEGTQETEIVEDRNCIQEMLDIQPIFFAFPFGNRGDFTTQSESIARSAGYTHIFSTETGFVDNMKERVIPRICIEDNTSVSTLVQWVNGGYDIYARLKQLCAR